MQQVVLTPFISKNKEISIFVTKKATKKFQQGPSRHFPQQREPAKRWMAIFY